ncbi:MAG: DNA polymerase III subunit gamma/tau [Patescibacteria group bacterium]|nr:DNA polymerase III subunit gamma/tau [Patescibacteria group bacterium]
MKKETVLYRQYRPQTFTDVLGQEPVVVALESSIKNGRVSHAYLFAGSRGTGKTSIARIFSRALKVSANDTYEIDAASNRGIDDIRELRDGVAVLPFESPYKVYILDEVHMLSKDAWNALLKTLEEPPAHVIFILATTELEKVPETVISRCQVFTFKKPSKAILKDLVESVAKSEKVKLAQGVSELVATLGDGSFRDTLGILQKVIGVSGDKAISIGEVEQITGAPKSSIINECVSAIAEKNVSVALSAIAKAAKEGISMKLFAELVLERLRAILLVRSAPALAKEIETASSEDDWKLVKDLSGKPDAVNSETLLSFIRAAQMIGRTSIDSLPLELAVVEVCKVKN